MVAILDLSNKAPTARVQLGSRDKSKILWPWPYDDTWSKFGAFGTILTIRSHVALLDSLIWHHMFLCRYI